MTLRPFTPEEMEKIARVYEGAGLYPEPVVEKWPLAWRFRLLLGLVILSWLVIGGVLYLAWQKL